MAAPAPAPKPAAAAAASPIRTIETRQLLADTIARTVAEQRLIQQEDAAAVRILSVPVIRGEPGHVYPSDQARIAAWNAETDALVAYLKVDPMDYTTAARRMRPYGMFRVGIEVPQWWKRLPDGTGFVLCSIDDVRQHRYDFDFRWRRFYRNLQGIAMGQPPYV